MKTNLSLFMALCALILTNSAMGMETSQNQQNENVELKAELHGEDTFPAVAFHPRGWMSTEYDVDPIIEELSKDELADIHHRLMIEKGLSKAELVEFATVMPVLEQVAIQECFANEGQLSQPTLAALLRHVPNMSRDEDHAKYLTNALIAQASFCGRDEIRQHRKNSVHATQFRDYVYQRHNIHQ